MMKKFIPLVFAMVLLPAFVPAPQPPKGRSLPTFGQVVRQEEIKQKKKTKKEKKLQKQGQWNGLVPIRVFL